MKPQLKVYNTRTKNIELFEHDINDPVNIYTCGPTVYNRAHIGNLKTFVWADFIIEYLNAIGYKTKHIINITDIDDKIINNLKSQDMANLIEFTTYYTDAFISDMEKLGIRSFNRENIHKVTDNIEPIINMINKLLDNGYAYKIPNGSIYFDSSKIDLYPFPDFQKPSDKSDYESERNIIRDEGVRSKNDFVLWKVKDNEELKWKTDIGTGRPGWHIECSAICLEHLGKVDIHMGGMDLKFPHHTCSVLQSESYNPTQLFGKYWFHMGFLNYAGDKMSKSIGNVIRLDNIKYNYFMLRWYLLSKPYQNLFNYNEDDLTSIRTDYINFHLLYNKLHYGFVKSHQKSEYNYSGAVDTLYNDIISTIANNFDVASALDVLNAFVSKIKNVYLEAAAVSIILDQFNKVNELLNLLDMTVLHLDKATLDYVNEREILRTQKEFKKTDEMRKTLENSFIFEDDRTGCSLINKI